MAGIFKGRVAIVTGAGSASGIGFAIARRLLQEDARVIITATSERIHDRAKELDAGGFEVVSFVGLFAVPLFGWTVALANWRVPREAEPPPSAPSTSSAGSP